MHIGLILVGVAIAAVGDAASAADLTLHTRHRLPAKSGQVGRSQVVQETVRLRPNETALLICDMWDHHWCAGATSRVGEMAPAMNEVVKRARGQGVFIIHAPSDTMEFYKDSPQRLSARNAPHATPPAPMDAWCPIVANKEPPLPIDDSDGGCDDTPQCKQHKAWTRQHPAIEIDTRDAITDSGPEVYNLLQQHGIKNVIVMGVHANMCVLGRSFGIRRLVAAGKRVALMRDMTDTMYNSRMRPNVSHFRGTQLLIEHVEAHWCPTVTSADFTHRPAFHFAADNAH